MQFGKIDCYICVDFIPFHGYVQILIPDESTDHLFQDYILIELSQSGLKGSTESSEVQTQEDDVTLVVNPNYMLED